MQTKLYHNNRCRKSREALNYLNEKGFKTVVVEYLKTPLSKKEWGEIFKIIGKKPSEMVRKQESLWKSDFKKQTLSESALLDILTQHPQLIERPIYIQDSNGVLARPIETLIYFLEKTQSN